MAKRSAAAESNGNSANLGFENELWRAADAFEQIVAPIADRILANLHETGTLVALRDALLPKLVSGELRVPNPGCLAARVK